MSSTSASVAAQMMLKFFDLTMASKEVPRGRTVPLEHGGLVDELIEIEAEVGVLGVAGRSPQCQLLATTCDPDRDVRGLQRLWSANRTFELIVTTLEVDHLLGPHPFHDLDTLLQLTQPHRILGEFVAIALILRLVPPGTDSHLETPS